MDYSYQNELVDGMIGPPAAENQRQGIKNRVVARVLFREFRPRPWRLCLALTIMVQTGTSLDRLVIFRSDSPACAVRYGGWWTGNFALLRMAVCGRGNTGSKNLSANWIWGVDR